MTRAQVLKLKALAEEAYQPEQYAANLPSGKPSAGSTRSGRKSLWRIRSEFVATIGHLSVANDLRCRSTGWHRSEHRTKKVRSRSFGSDRSFTE
jgi:hypothetical protein